MDIRSYSFSVLTTLLTLCAAPAVAQTTIAADTFVDSIGVNIHLHYFDTIYFRNFPLIKSRLLELGVRHVRDGIVDTTWQDYYERHNELGAAGIKGLFIMGATDSSALLKSYPSRMATAFEAYEAPNEHNWSGDPDWPGTLRSALTRLHALKQVPALAKYPIIGPSLTEQYAYGVLGDISSMIDAGNLHNYFSGRHPGTDGWGAHGYGSIDWNLANVQPYSGGKPIVTTETGYWDDMGTTAAIPADVAGVYMPRLALEQFRKGITRTYVYELCDYPVGQIDNWSGYGLLTSTGVAKPAFHALKGLISLLADPGPAITVQPLQYTVSGGTSALRHMAFQKRDGSYYLAVWLEASSYDVGARVPMTVSSQAVTVSLPASVQALNAYRWNGTTGAVARTTLAHKTQLPVTVTDKLTIIELQAAPTAPSNLRLMSMR